MIRFLAMLALLLSAGAVAGPLALTPSDRMAIRTFLTRTLAAYVADRDAPPWHRAFTPEMQQLLKLNERFNQGQESEVLGADPICGCQDWQTIRVTGIRLSPRADGKVTATVGITNFGPATRVFLLARTRDGWRVDDVIEGGRYGLRRALLRDNARLGGRPPRQPPRKIRARAA